MHVWVQLGLAVRVQLNPPVLNNMGIAITDVATTLQNANAHQAKGSVENGTTRWQINATDQLFHAAQYAPLIVTYRNGAPVRLRDLGNVIDSVEDTRNDGLDNGKPDVILAIARQPQANIIATVDHIKAMLPLLRASIPPSIHLKVAQDRTTTIRASVHDVEVTLLISVGLVVLVGFCLPPQWLGDANSRHRGADLSAWDIRGDVPAWLHTRQFVTDGADGFDGFRCR